MANEYEYLHEAFDEGDIYSFSLRHFEDMEDLNIQTMVKLCKKSEETIFSIMNLNGIQEKEINLNEEEYAPQQESVLCQPAVKSNPIKNKTSSASLA